MPPPPSSPHRALHVHHPHLLQCNDGDDIKDKPESNQGPETQPCPPAPNVQVTAAQHSIAKGGAARVARVQRDLRGRKEEAAPFSLPTLFYCHVSNILLVHMFSPIPALLPCYRYLWTIVLIAWTAGGGGGGGELHYLSTRQTLVRACYCSHSPALFLPFSILKWHQKEYCVFISC